MAEPGVGGPRLTATETPNGTRLSWQDYSVRWASTHGGFDPRRGSAVVRAWLRMAYHLARVLAALRVSPNAATLAGLVASVAVPVVVLWRDWWLLVAAGLVLITAVADSVDGAIAIAGGRETPLGSWYDAVADRLSEASWLVALWLLGAPGWLVTLAGALSWLHEYARACAGLAGMSEIGVVTVAERPTRVILTVTALVLGGAAFVIDARLAAGVVTVVAAVWVVLGLLGGARLYDAIRTSLRRPSAS